MIHTGKNTTGNARLVELVRQIMRSTCTPKHHNLQILRVLHRHTRENQQNDWFQLHFGLGSRQKSKFENLKLEIY